MAATSVALLWMGRRHLRWQLSVPPPKIWGRVRRQNSSRGRTTGKNSPKESQLNHMKIKEKARVNRIGEVHCRRRKRREEREIGPNLRSAGYTAQSEKSFVSRGFSGAAPTAEKAHDDQIWRRDRDSNPGCHRWHNGFRDRPVQPLRHPSDPRCDLRTHAGGSKGSCPLTDLARAWPRRSRMPVESLLQIASQGVV
jgi:hypothetical protein